MKRINVLYRGAVKNDAAKYGCLECQSSCQSACKTSCTIGNQNCAKTEKEKKETIRSSAK